MGVWSHVDDIRFGEDVAPDHYEDIGTSPMTMSKGKEVFEPWIETPLIESPSLSAIAGCRVFLKLENLQPGRSFKSRGIGNLVYKAVQRSSRPIDQPLTFYASSGGNAGLACAVAATSLKQRSVIVVPHTTKQGMIDKLIRAGATEVIQQGQNIAETDLYLKQTLLRADPDGVYVPPFDHEDIWEGNESIVHEIHEQMGKLPDKVVCSVGGGGLLVGICQGMEKIQSTYKTLEVESSVPSLPTPSSTPPDTPSSFLLGPPPLGDSIRDASSTSNMPRVIGVETEGCESFHLSIKHRSLVTLPAISSIATSLGCVRITPRALEYGLQSHVSSIVMSDREACEASLRFLEDEKILVEPACGVTLGLVYSGRLREMLQVEADSVPVEDHTGVNRTSEKKVVLVVCGGSNIGLADLLSYKERFGI